MNSFVVSQPTKHTKETKLSISQNRVYPALTGLMGFYLHARGDMYQDGTYHHGLGYAALSGLGWV